MTSSLPRSDIPAKKADEHHPTKAGTLRSTFFYGLIVGLPIAATVGLIYWVVSRFDKLIKPVIPEALNPDTYLPFNVPGIGLIVTVAGIFLLGIFARNFLGRQIIGFGERLVNRVPVMNVIYNFVKQIVDTFSSNSDKSFREVCLVEYPRKDVWAMGFVTSDVRGAPADVLPQGYVNVFVPTTPNPTSGFLLMVKREEIRLIDMTTEEGAKLIVSAGVVSSEKPLEGLTEPKLSTPKKSKKTKAKAKKSHQDI